MQLNIDNNIAVDPTFKCHAERSRSIYLKRGLRSFTLVQDDKFAKKMSRGSTAILLLMFLAVFFVGVGIGFALLAHPCLGLLCKKSGNHLRCLYLIFVSYLLVSELPAAIKRKSGATFVVPDFLRRERDSNPRYLSVRRFSRPVQSTTLPPLQKMFLNEKVVCFRLMMQRYIKKIYRARKSDNFFGVFAIFFALHCEMMLENTIFAMIWQWFGCFEKRYWQ